MARSTRGERTRGERPSSASGVEPLSVEITLLEPSESLTDEELAAPRRGGDFIVRGLARWSRLDRRKRRFSIAAALAAIVVALGLLVVLSQPSSQTRVVPAPAPTTSVRFGIVQPPNPGPSLNYTYGIDVDDGNKSVLVPGGDVRDIAITKTTLYVLTTSAIVVVDLVAGQVVRQISVRSSTDARLLTTPSDERVFVYDVGTVPANVQEFDSTTLQITRRFTVQDVVYDAAWQDGWLYLATSGGVYALAPFATDVFAVATTNPPARVLVADPTEDAIKALSSGPAGRIVTIKGQGTTIKTGPALEVANPTFAATADTLWAGGIGTGGRIVRIDPESMAPIVGEPNQAALDPKLGSGLQLTAGVVNLWAYSPSADRLYCVDAHTGRVLQYWDRVSGTVAPGSSGPYVIGDRSVVALTLRGGCRG